MTQQEAQFLVECSDFSGNDATLREDYSGRGMMGKTTFGVVVDHPLQLLNDVLQYVKDNFEDSKEYVGMEIPDFASFKFDSMGRQMIIY